MTFLFDAEKILFLILIKKDFFFLKIGLGTIIKYVKKLIFIFIC